MANRKSSKLPAFQFYPGDWLKDPALRSVSATARGLWIDMLCLMHESERRGYLQIASNPLDDERVLRCCNTLDDDGKMALKELEDAGVFSRDSRGAIYSRRMVRDEEKRDKCRQSGKLGGKTKAENRYKNARQFATQNASQQNLANGLAKPLANSRSSSSSSSSSSIVKPPLPPLLDTDRFRSAWDEWESHRKHKGNKLTAESRKRQIKKLEAIGHDRAIAAIEHSIAQGYTGVFEPTGDGGRTSGAGRISAPAGKYDGLPGEPLPYGDGS